MSGGDELSLTPSTAPDVTPAEAVKLVVPGRWNYRERVRFYAAEFQASEKTIKNWVATGRKAVPPDMPPLDERSKMSTWWARRMKHRVPENILRMGAPEDSRESFPGVTAPTRIPSSNLEKSVGDNGSMIQRLRDAEREAHAAYALALAAIPLDPGAVELRQRAWQRLADDLRKGEESEVKLAESRGDSLPRRETGEHLRDIHRQLARSLRGFMDGMLPQLRGLSEQEMSKKWAEKTEEFLASLQNVVL